MTTKFEAELIRHLAEPAPMADIDVSRALSARLERQARTRQGVARAAAGACTILTALAVMAGFGFADDGLPQIGLTGTGLTGAGLTGAGLNLADAGLLWLPFAILAALLTFAGATLSASLLRSGQAG